MRLCHTHLTTFIRSDYELAALHAMIVMNNKTPNPDTIRDLEEAYRGNSGFEEAVRGLANWLEKFSPGFKAEPHPCVGQLCDHDGLYTVIPVVKEQDSQDEESL